MATAFENMDAMYRRQRYIYDATRKFYLLGRDTLIEQMDVRSGQNILEVGCGTGRNLAILAKKYPDANFFGLDASSEMLKSAEAKIEAAGAENVSLKLALANDFGYQETFGLDEPFDAIFFSYSISMIPPWKEAICTALANLKPGSSFYIVDFYDQRDLPSWFRRILKSWLRKFHVQFWSDLVPHLFELDKRGFGNLEIIPVARRYAFIAVFRTSAAV